MKEAKKKKIINQIIYKKINYLTQIMEASTPKKNQNTKEDNHDLDLDFEEAQALFEVSKQSQPKYRKK